MREMAADSEAISKAVKAGVEHRGADMFTVMIVAGEMQAVRHGKVVFAADIMRSDGHEIFSAFLKAWCNAGIADECSC